MPRRKISVEEAFKVLEQAGIQVRVQEQEQPVQQPVPEKPRRNAYGSIEMHTPKKDPKTAKITLYAKHTIGSGGVQVGEDGKQIEHAGVQIYGPGVCTVPVEHVNHLLHADRIAREADEQMLSPIPKHKLILPIRDGQGYRKDIGVEVSEDMLDPGTMLTRLPLEYTYVIRG